MNRPSVEELVAKNGEQLNQANAVEYFNLYAIYCHNCGQVEYSFTMGGSAFDFCDGPNNNEYCRVTQENGECNFDVVDLTGRDTDYLEWTQVQLNPIWNDLTEAKDFNLGFA